jgi:plasmid stabilization system protein ParE
MRAVRWSREAQRDIADIDDYCHALDPSSAARIAQQVTRAAAFLAQNPEAGERIAGTLRKWRVAGSPYLLFYRPSPGVLRISRVVHGARGWRQGSA